MTDWDTEVDFLVVGSGAGGMAAALTANQQGLSTLVLEKSGKYGGTSALSGGVIWIPNNHHMVRAGIRDSAQEAFRYLDQVVSADVSRDFIRTYVDRAPEMLRFMEQHTLLKYDPAPEYPDYYCELEGGKPGARSLDPRPYSLRKLGLELLHQMRSDSLNKRIKFSMTAAEAHIIFSFTWRSSYVIFKRLFLYMLDVPSRLRKLPDNRITLGKALISRLRHSMQLANVPLWLNASMDELVQEQGQVIGVVCRKDGKTLRIKAQHGVLLATGGFAKNDAMRERYQSPVTSGKWSAASPTDTGDGIRMGEAVNAQLAMMKNAWWTPSMLVSSDVAEAFIVGKSLPSCMVVNKAGERFCNEAEPYEDFVKHQLSAPEALPAYFIFDGRYRKEYPLGTILAQEKFLPDSAYKTVFKQGVVKKASTLEALADQCGIDQEGLLKTAQRMASFSQKGIDEDFGKGSTANDRYYSDHRIKPNPCLAPVMQPPFYAIELWPGDLSTKGGLKTNVHAQVLNQQGEVIAGLYATGNTMASVMGDSYPGAGSTLGPAMTFGYVAALHAAQSGVDADVG